MESNMSEYNLGGEAEEYLGQINGSPRKGDDSENMVRAGKCWFYDLQVLECLTRDKDTPLQPMYPTKISITQYGLGDASKGGFGSGLYMSNDGSDGTEGGPGRVHTTNGVGVRNTRVNPVTTGK